MANKFNNFFCNIAGNLVNKLPQKSFDGDELKTYYIKKGVKGNSFKFTVISEDELMKLLKSMNVNKSTGSDGISARFVKDSSNVIVAPLTYIVNLSLRTCKVPDGFKEAKVIPLYKKGNSNLEGNYRPVSILPVISKLLERIVYDQLYKYLCDNNLIYQFQSGFRPMFSTDTALTYLSDRLKMNIDKGMYTGVILLDLQKAFDTVDHVILENKLKAIGCDDCVNWFHSYLCNRSQFVNVNGVVSSSQVISCGVPQGSILGPLLFSIYVNDMERALDCDLCLYADDSMLLVSGKDVKQIEAKLCIEMDKIKNWLDINKLSLHLGKTESILFASKRKLKKASELNITCQGVKIESKSNVKYLGAVLDQDMSGTTMGKSVIKKVNASLKFLYRKSGCLKFTERKLLCSSLLQSRIDYAFNVYYRSLQKCIRNKVQTAQNKFVRFILGYDSRFHLTSSDFKKVKFLDIENRFTYLSLNMIHNVHSGRSPLYLCNFQSTQDVHQHNTRNSSLSYVIPQVNKQGSTTFMYNAAKAWNSIPVSLRAIESKNSFKHKCKLYLFSKMDEVEKNDFVM